MLFSCKIFVGDFITATRGLGVQTDGVGRETHQTHRLQRLELKRAGRKAHSEGDPALVRLNHFLLNLSRT